MKKALLILTIFAQANLFAQIPNSGFENWTNKGTYMDPQGWWSANDSVKSGSYYPVTQSTDHYPANVGSYSLRLESQEATAFPPPEWQDWGLCWTGGWNGNNYPAFPVTGHPTSLCGYYKWIPQNGDTMNIHILLYSGGVQVAIATLQDSTSATSWTSFQIPISSYSTVDSARIMLMCYADHVMIAHGNSVLYVDNLSFDNLITGIPEVTDLHTLNIYPNPATDVLNISMPQAYCGNTNVAIYDITGRIVMQYTFVIRSNYFPVDISTLPSGVYLLRINTETGSLINKFVKK